MKFSVRATLLVAALVSTAACQKGDSFTLNTEDNSQTIAYTIGHDLGMRLAQQDPTLNADAFAAGFRDGYSGQPPQLTQQQIMAAMQDFRSRMEARQADMQKAQMKQFAEATTVNAEKSKKFLAMIEAQEGVKKSDSGLLYKIEREGSGTPPTANDMVKVHYRGQLVDGTVFDSSYDRGEPAVFPVGGVIPGWTEALQMMKPGSKWRIYLPPELAYGERGAPPRIGPNEALQFEVELIEVVKDQQAH
ncbi:MAG: FKBP-type peptidyl-prolyl cis-trans isomerase [Candidatus Dadabacteria bacterium]|nr:MAG: FKBP-type peptidyl-prolyl cis-trans isomerase [Candidatus Dadabacteria bacterium]